jgi:hypothetical protein
MSAFSINQEEVFDLLRKELFSRPWILWDITCRMLKLETNSCAYSCSIVAFRTEWYSTYCRLFIHSAALRSMFENCASLETYKYLNAFHTRILTRELHHKFHHYMLQLRSVLRAERPGIRGSDLLIFIDAMNRIWDGEVTPAVPYSMRAFYFWTNAGGFSETPIPKGTGPR